MRNGETRRPVRRSREGRRTRTRTGPRPAAGCTVLARTPPSERPTAVLTASPVWMAVDAVPTGTPRPVVPRRRVDHGARTKLTHCPTCFAHISPRTRGESPAPRPRHHASGSAPRGHTPRALAQSTTCRGQTIGTVRYGKQACPSCLRPSPPHRLRPPRRAAARQRRPRRHSAVRRHRRKNLHQTVRTSTRTRRRPPARHCRCPRPHCQHRHRQEATHPTCLRMGRHHTNGWRSGFSLVC